jgi:hypothetical protein
MPATTASASSTLTLPTDPVVSLPQLWLSFWFRLDVPESSLTEFVDVARIDVNAPPGVARFSLQFAQNFQISCVVNGTSAGTGFLLLHTSEWTQLTLHVGLVTAGGPPLIEVFVNGERQPQPVNCPALNALDAMSTAKASIGIMRQADGIQAGPFAVHFDNVTFDIAGR